MTTSGVTPTTTTAASTTSAASSQLSSNFNTFLTLLTTQLQNQDPLSPMDSNQFTQQLVQYSQVEQQINTNSNLQNLISLQQSGASASAVSYLGKNVTVTNGNAALTGGTANWNYTLSGPTASTQLTVTNSSGQAVYTGAGATTAGSNSFAWNGKDNNGVQLPDGTYTLTVGATASDGSTVKSTVSSSGVVSEINMSGTTPQLVIGSMTVPLSQVAAVHS